MLVLLLACAPSPAADTGDSAGGASAATDTGFCAGVPTVTYANFGNGFLTGNCRGCHASTSPDRHGAPEDVTFDTVAQVWERAAAVLAVATGEAPIMPPQGGVTDDDRTLLEWWLRCAEPGT